MRQVWVSQERLLELLDVEEGGNLYPLIEEDASIIEAIVTHQGIRFLVGKKEEA